MTATASGTFHDALEEHLNALQAKDVERFGNTLGDDVIVVDGKGALVRGTDAVCTSHAEWFRMADPWRFNYDVVFTRELGASAGLALLDVTYRHTPDAQPARFMLSLVFERETSGRWSFVYDQNTPLPSP